MALALVLASAGLAGLAVYLWRAGLQRANELASVIAMFVALLSVVGGVATLLRSGQADPAAGVRRVRRQRTAWGVLRLGDEVRRLLEATLSMAEAAPYPLPGGRHGALSAVYVRQRLELRREDEEGAPWERDDLPREPRSRWGSGVRPVPVSLPLDRVLGEHRHLLLEGGPGQGKSTTARQVCRQLALAWLDGGRQPAPLPVPAVPVLVSARGLAGYRGLPWPQALARAAAAELGMRLGGPVPAGLTAGLTAGACWFVVVDGVDEVPAGEREELLGMLAGRIAAAGSPDRLMITSRPLAAHARAALRASVVGQYGLVPFDRAALRSFARAWFGADSDPAGAGLAAGFLAEVRAAGLDDVTAVPLLATIAITVYERDPARRLPRNRHDLYEQYLTHLWEASHERRQALRARIAQRVGDLPDGRRAGRALLDRLDALVEHLAVVRLDTRDPLLPAALRWLEDQRLIPGRTPAAWDRWIADLLSNTGVLKVQGNGVEFVHQSFAEHYAARVHARGLPATFAEDDPGWRRWIAMAAEDEPAALAVLTTWARGHDPAALLAWLLAGAAQYQEIAVRLVSEGTPAGEAAVPACLRLVEHEAWATRPYWGLDQVENLFGLVRRLPAGPVVTGWLESMVSRSGSRPAVLAHAALLLADRDPARRAGLADVLRRMVHTTDAYDRPAVAAALAELAPSHRAEAAGALATLLDDTQLNAVCRGQVATTLADLGPDTAGSATSGLRAALHDTRVLPGDRAGAARTLVELDGDHRDEATEVLLALLRDPAVPARDLVRAALALAAVAADRTGDAAAALAAVAATPAADDSEQVEAADELAGLGPRYRPDGIAALLAIMHAPLTSAIWREYAADRLCGYDGEHRQEALDTVLAIVLDPQEERYERGNARSTLSHLDADQRPQAVAVLRPVLQDPDRPALVQRDVASVLCRIDPGAAQEVASALGCVLDDPLVSAADICWTADDLARLGPQYCTRAAQVLLGVAHDPHSDGSDRRQAAYFLRALGPEHDGQAAALLGAILDDPSAPAGDIVGAANDLFRCGPGHRQRGVHALLALIQDTETPYADRDSARVLLLQELPGYRPEVARAYRDLLAAGAADPGELVALARDLGQLGWEDHSLAASVLRSVINAPLATCGERAAAAGALARLGPDHHPAAGQTLHAVATDPYAAAADKIAAAQALLTLGPGHRAAATSALRALTGDPRVAAGDRCAAAQALLPLGDDHRDLATRALRTVSADPHATVSERYAAAWQLAGMNDDDAIAVLGELLAEPELPDADRLTAARALRRLDHAGQRNHAAAALRAIMTGGHADPGRQLAAAQALTGVEPAHRPEVLTALRRIVTDSRSPDDARRPAIDALITLGSPADHDRAVCVLKDACTGPAAPGQPPAVPALDPVTAAEILFGTAPRHRAEAVPVLRALLADADECRSQRLRAARALSGGGPADRAVVAGTLTAWLAEPGLPVLDQCALITELHAVHPRAASQALDGFRAAITQPATRPREQHDAAQTLLAIRPGDTGAAQALARMVADPATPPATRRAAAATLAAGHPAHRQLAVRHLQALLAATPAPAELTWAAGLLARTSASHRDQAVAVLSKLTSPAQAAQTRLRAAAELASAGGPATLTGAAALLALAGDSLQPPHIRARAALKLISVPGPQQHQGRTLLLQIAADPAINLTDRALAGCHAAALPGPTRQQALRSLGTLLTDPRLPARLVLAAAEASSQPGQALPAAARVERLAGDRTIHPYLRCQALRLLATCHPPARDHATRRLWKLLTDREGNADHRRWAAESLAAIAASLRTPARSALRDIEASHPLDHPARRRLHRSMHTISRGP